MNKLDRLASLLAGGMKASSAALIVGVSASYVSQKLADPEFKEGVLLLREELANNTDGLGHSAKEERAIYSDALAGAEHEIVDQLRARVQSGLMEDRNLISALAMVGARRDAMDKTTLMSLATSSMGEALAGGATVRMVEITMPAICVPELIIGGNSEILSIGNRSTATMPVGALQKMLDAHTNNEVIEHDSYH